MSTFLRTVKINNRCWEMAFKSNEGGNDRVSIFGFVPNLL